MPIYGMTGGDDLVPEFSRIGKLRKGGPKKTKEKNGKKIEVVGEDLGYFRFTSPDPEIETAFRKAYADEPKALTVLMAFLTVEETFPTWMELWKAGGLVHRCNGEAKTIWLEGKAYHTGCLECDAPCRGNNPACGASPVGRLSVILPKLWAAGHVGFVTMETHSKHDVMNITKSLLQAIEWRARAGMEEFGLSGIRWTLRRSQEEISTPGEDGRTTRKHWLVRLDPEAEWAHLILAGERKRAMLPAGQVIDGQARVVDTATGEILEDVEPPEDMEPPDAWKNDSKRLEEVKAVLKRHDLLQDEGVLKALDVAKITEFQGDFETLLEMIESYAEWKVQQAAKAALDKLPAEESKAA